MKIIRVSLDEELAAAVDRTARRLGASRSGFVRQALQDAVEKKLVRDMERRHREGYLRRPVGRWEFDIDESDRIWGD